MKFVRVEVEAYSGYRAAERPLAFTRHGRRQVIETVLDRWYEGGLSPRSQKLDYFKVRTGRGEELILRYNPLFDAWSVLDKTGRATPNQTGEVR